MQTRSCAPVTGPSELEHQHHRSPPSHTSRGLCGWSSSWTSCLLHCPNVCSLLSVSAGGVQTPNLQDAVSLDLQCNCCLYSETCKLGIHLKEADSLSSQDYTMPRELRCVVYMNPLLRECNHYVQQTGTGRTEYKTPSSSLLCKFSHTLCVCMHV